jgi:hypothetical protein
MIVTAYHSTSISNAKSIISNGFRVPSSTTHSATDSRVGDYFSAIFFARNEKNAIYGNAIIKVKLNGKFMKLLQRKSNESASDVMHRSISIARKKGFDGVDTKYDTIGIAVINPKIISILNIGKRN